MSTNIRPNENDVLLGRGGNNHSHCGNEQLRRIAHERAGEYRASTKKEKAVISRHIMHHIQSLEPPGRFLSKNYSRCEWEVVTDAVAREKVCQAFRDAVAIERDKEQNIKSSAKMCWTHCVTPKSATTCDDAARFLYQSNIFDDNMNPIVTPIKQEMVDDSEEVPTDQYYQSNNFEGTNPIVSPIKQEMMDELFDEDPNLCHHQSVNFQNAIPVIHYPPIKQEMVDDECDDEEESYHQYHCNVYDDFDLFDGELLRNIEVDEVLSNAAV